MPTAQLVARRETQCGKTQYSADYIGQAAQTACQYVRQGDSAGSSSYPHQYKNYEGFEFEGLPGPFFEFPILSSGEVYAGGRPGPDRIVIDEDCREAGEITHTGADGNSFIGCSGTN
ncbi:hypothetical protein CDD81_386 [Ophiocordyceps australis]|uniref:ribonuclease T1 n=1 Tax=Ophiocordyceps australis TaxID=1399860 RepID=A0A2C5XVV9_9HYPO|nr:hypothetical protein CDD81_386 [Ophiocordyceps australis]